MIACTKCFESAGQAALTLHRTGDKTLRVQFAETTSAAVQSRQPELRRVAIAFSDTTFTPLVRHLHNEP